MQTSASDKKPISSEHNDQTLRHEIWRRYTGNEWDAFDALPASIKQRVNDHAYNAWSVNVLMLWKHYKRIYGRTVRAEKALIRYLDYCERLERKAFAEHYYQACGDAYPHDAAQATVLRTFKKK
ncbi:DUF6525 family protein [Swingsia samuiensis]|uniref:Uncharacterized protein n=1 Tax=Swingsia samuiensis TaxID=1293412 RepID=A0A4Y6UKT5_9PROT|nr:DUF6525 family protein [Swingsia samuiensis]QDH16987.1 hypothetical protein E3D00_04985 [Swingsia samuiensis]